jgi:hypothetical protein
MKSTSRCLVSRSLLRPTAVREHLEPLLGIMHRRSPLNAHSHSMHFFCSTHMWTSNLFSTTNVLIPVVNAKSALRVVPAGIPLAVVKKKSISRGGRGSRGVSPPGSR